MSVEEVLRPPTPGDYSKGRRYVLPPASEIVGKGEIRDYGKALGGMIVNHVPVTQEQKSED